ncbi:hypothetical protein [Acidianus manzaensis]|uniref:Uncharacterized protein n=1 Tax=Acidianus manzaensis TaxID=282676 RepID=A0A1W6JZY5_9CREN|nr:hypothetical protein [Acidianus manzaensis]ARM75795.1 hypothetical protein B6F84_06930 [Acidianus manzaensis]
MLIRVEEKEFDKIFTRLKEMIYEYNSKISGTDVYLKPFHIVYKNGKKYIYIGKYWYKLEKINGKVKWIYLGKQKPINNLPDPPKFPEITIIKDEKSYIVDDEILYNF